LDELSASASLGIPEPSPSSFDAPGWSPHISPPAAEDLSAVYHQPVHNPDVVRPAPPLAPVTTDAPSPDQAAVEALRERWVRTQATTRPDEDTVILTHQPNREDAPTWPASPPGPAMAVNLTQTGPVAEADANDQGGDSINRGLLLKFLSSVRS